jgi:hypothetical protein
MTTEQNFAIITDKLKVCTVTYAISSLQKGSSLTELMQIAITLEVIRFNELSSPARTLRSWVRIPLKA